MVRADDERLRSAATLALALVLLQLGVGALNITLLAPIWMQLVHLLLADVVWISLVVLTLESTHVKKPATHWAYA
jgi:heme A synthase